MLNQCNFIGRVAADVEIRRTSSGNQVANFTLAVGEKYKDKHGNPKESVEWVKVVCWSEGLIKVLENYVNKGDLLFISGKMKTRSWEDQQGQKRYSTELVMQGFDSKLTMLGSKSGNGNQSNTADDYQAPDLEDDLDQSIPF